MSLVTQQITESFESHRQSQERSSHPQMQLKDDTAPGISIVSMQPVHKYANVRSSPRSSQQRQRSAHRNREPCIYGPGEHRVPSVTYLDTEQSKGPRPIETKHRDSRERSRVKSSSSSRSTGQTAPVKIANFDFSNGLESDVNRAALDQATLNNGK